MPRRGVRSALRAGSWCSTNSVATPCRRRWRSKAHVVLPSATPLPPLAPRHRTFDVAVVGHLRAVKDPRLPMRVARGLPDHSKIRVLHAGMALERGWSRAARSTARATDHYRWLGGVSGAAARALIRRARVLLHPSKEEGGATVIVEALQSGTPVIASDCARQRGPARSGLSRPVPGRRRRRGPGAAAARRSANRGSIAALLAAARRRARLFTPAREGRSLRRLVHNSLKNNPPPPR